MYEVFGLPRGHHCFFCCNYHRIFHLEDKTFYVCEECGQRLDLSEYWFVNLSKMRRIGE